MSTGRANPKHVLILGAAGMLGRAWRELLAREEIEFAATDSRELDICDEAALARSVDGRFDTIVNCAAWTDVDGAETNEAAARRLNGDAVALVARCAERTGATLIHYSTDYVFDGHATEPIPVDAPRAPAGAYGRTKAAGEEALEQSNARHLLIRTSWLYAPWGKNFVRTIARAAREREELTVVDDQRGRPTSCEHLAAASLALLRAGATGTLHVSDGGDCTWCGFAAEIVRVTGAACRVRPITTAELNRPAPRPAWSVLDLSGTERIIGPMPRWEQNLADVLGRLEA